MGTINFRELIESAQGDDTPPPAGSYSAVVETAEWRQASTGKDMLNLRMRIEGGPENGKALFTNLVIAPHSPTALRIFFGQMAALGITAEQLADMPEHQSEQAVIGRRINVTTTLKEWQGEVRAEVKTITSSDLVPPHPRAAEPPPPLARPTPPPPPPVEPF